MLFSCFAGYIWTLFHLNVTFISYKIALILKPMSPTIKDVAQKAGVSLSTVSLVINSKSLELSEIKTLFSEEEILV